MLLWKYLKKVQKCSTRFGACLCTGWSGRFSLFPAIQFIMYLTQRQLIPLWWSLRSMPRSRECRLAGRALKSTIWTFALRWQHFLWPTHAHPAFSCIIHILHTHPALSALVKLLPPCFSVSYLQSCLHSSSGLSCTEWLPVTLKGWNRDLPLKYVDFRYTAYKSILPADSITGRLCSVVAHFLQ